MEENKKEIFEKEKGKFFSKKIKIILIILILMFIIVFGYVSLIKADNCKDEKCFFDSLRKCKRAYFLNQDLEYSWNYLISKEASENACEVKVKLLEVKQNSVYSEMLQKKEMTCIVPKTKIEFPEKDISSCSGILKENLQDLIIQRMYDYLLTNIQEINTSFLEPL